MKKTLISMIILLLMLAACAPGSDLEVTTPETTIPETTIELTIPGPNPQVNVADAEGGLAGAAQGLWHGLIAPVTVIGAFFNPAMQMYEVHNNGREYNLGFLVGVALVFLILGLFGGRQRWR
jgi:hypothetical protein